MGDSTGIGVTVMESKLAEAMEGKEGCAGGGALSVCVGVEGCAVAGEWCDVWSDVWVRGGGGFFTSDDGYVAYFAFVKCVDYLCDE